MIEEGSQANPATSGIRTFFCSGAFLVQLSVDYFATEQKKPYVPIILFFFVVIQRLTVRNLVDSIMSVADNDSDSGREKKRIKQPLRYRSKTTTNTE